MVAQVSASLALSGLSLEIMGSENTCECSPSNLCLSTDRPSRDFNVAMKTGSMNGNINMGPETHTQLIGSYKFWGEEHAVDITNAVARAGKVYESRLDKEFCVGIDACGSGSKEL